ncbi:heterokaryon incompatibility protein-domain-containing protein [Fusarium solani]|uniref:Heterokaryon incompatibility protein-domain-containing protein n=1 Tax=Fusarium solani TaxID=169388 RepID=A0A9P9JX32_FUSSL|nr:heterokaryon incompatibility protein-domain-containing protein [Fusarium solani]KAH7232004.1 heterokaryon incompatibility protein-domain-containing protein [Fusarium solani]
MKLKDQPATWEGLVNNHEMSLYAGSQEAYIFMECCLARCARHLSCYPSTRDVPTRLIDVGSLNDTKVRLVETTSTAEYRYVALNYCCGKSEVVKTISKNYRIMQKGIKVSRLPRTIQYAIEVTRKLSQRHLWVDAICIIQDSLSDWEYESARMASVYRDAYLTIAIGTASSATEGFLHHRHLAASQKPPFRAECQYGKGEKFILGARIIPDKAAHTQQRDGGEELPLYLRGWTLQKSQLSRHKAEERSWGVSSGFKSLLSIDNSDQAFQHWHLTVDRYLSRELTNSMDKLPAISGIARVIQDITHSGYLAGIWSDNLTYDLAWAVVSAEMLSWSSERFVLSQYRGPTFSWVSIDDKVLWERLWGWVPASPFALIQAESTVEGKNPLGVVKSAHITLHGLTLTTTLRLAPMRNRNQSLTYYVRRGAQDLHLHADTTLETFELVTQGVVERSVRRSPLGSTKHPAASDSPVILLLLGHGQGLWADYEGEDIKKRKARWIYLVLGKSPMDVTKYQRLGRATECYRDVKALESLEGLEDLGQFMERTITII